MKNQIKIRPSEEFRELLDYIRGQCMMNGTKIPSMTELTKVIAKQIDREKLWQDEFNKI